MLEDPNSKGSETKTNDVKCHKTQEDQNQRRAVVAGFHDDMTQQEVQEVQHVLEETRITIGMSMEQNPDRPAKPITHAFLQLSPMTKETCLSGQQTY